MATPVRETAPGLGFAFTLAFGLVFASVESEGERRQYFAGCQGHDWGGVETGGRDRSDPLYSGTRCMRPPLRGEGRSCLGP